MLNESEIKEEQIKQLNEACIRGRLAEEFLKSELWVNHLEPNLKNTKQALAVKSIELPFQIQDSNKLSVILALQAGQLEAYRSLESELADWVEQYHQASFKLKKMQEQERN